MMRKAWLLLIAGCIALASPAAAQQRDDLLIFTGFDYQVTGAPGLYFLGASDDGYRALGFVPRSQLVHVPAFARAVVDPLTLS